MSIRVVLLLTVIWCLPVSASEHSKFRNAYCNLNQDWLVNAGDSIKGFGVKLKVPVGTLLPSITYDPGHKKRFAVVSPATIDQIDVKSIADVTKSGYDETRQALIVMQNTGSLTCLFKVDEEVLAEHYYSREHDFGIHQNPNGSMYIGALKSAVP